MSFGLHMGGIHKAWQKVQRHNSKDHSLNRYIFIQQSSQVQHNKDFHMLSLRYCLAHRDYSSQNLQSLKTRHNRSKDFLALDLYDIYQADEYTLFQK
jgi:hypothetical protein